jgi:hypothetical protein
MHHKTMITDVKNCRGKIGLMKAWKDIIGSVVKHEARVYRCDSGWKTIYYRHMTQQDLLLKQHQLRCCNASSA